MDSNVFLTGINSGKFAWLLVYVLVYTVYVINVDRSSVYGAQVYSHGFVLTLWLFFYVGKSIIGTYFGRSYLTIIALALLLTSCYTIVLDAFSLFVTLKERPTWLSVEDLYNLDLYAVGIVVSILAFPLISSSYALNSLIFNAPANTKKKTYNSINALHLTRIFWHISLYIFWIGSDNQTIFHIGNDFIWILSTSMGFSGWIYFAIVCGLQGTSILLSFNSDDDWRNVFTFVLNILCAVASLSDSSIPVSTPDTFTNSASLLKQLYRSSTHIAPPYIASALSSRKKNETYQKPIASTVIVNQNGLSQRKKIKDTIYIPIRF